ncbi:MAG: hypothetical protein JO354_12225 [Verrucomicrobia bacterium]|nr:hypothetical protein [Verrucomicrobiota bacterium]
MKTPRRLRRLTGWVSRCALAFVTLAFCASTFASDPSKNVVMPARAQAKAQRTAQPAIAPAAAKKQYYVMISPSAIPQPFERIATPIPTTAVPMQIIGNNRGQ